MVVSGIAHRAGLVVVYQLYRFTYIHSLSLIALTALDLLVIGLIWHAGIFSDYLGRGKLIVCGWGIYAAIYFGFGMATAAWHVAALYVL